MKSVTIIYGSTTGNTQRAAQSMKKKLATFDVKLVDVAKASQADLESASNLILGTSTWGLGDLQDDWDSFLPLLQRSSLSGKTVALYGLGDGSSYSDTFVEGMAAIYRIVKAKDCRIIGQTPIDGYDFSESSAVVDGTFVGLALDEDNESEKSDGRIDTWLDNIASEFC